MGRTPEQVWQVYDGMERRLAAPLTQRMLELAALKHGHDVLDLATGRGEPAIEAARRVAPTGRVCGVDIFPAMLDMARRRAVDEGITNLELVVGDAEKLNDCFTDEAMPRFDATLCRWGLMYFQSPVAALQAARWVMKPGGILVAAVWAEPTRVPYYSFPRQVLSQFMELPPLDDELPGTFRLSRIEQIERDFHAGGFALQSIEEMEVEVMEVQNGSELVEWARCFGMNRLLENQPVEVESAWEEALVREGELRRRDDWIRLGGITRIIVARSLWPDVVGSKSVG